MNNERLTGVLISWFQDKAYGFIQTTGQTRNIFLHISNFDPNDEPKLGDIIEYELGEAAVLGRPRQAVKAKTLLPSQENIVAAAGTLQKTEVRQ